LPMIWAEMLPTFQVGILGHAMLEYLWRHGTYNIFDCVFVDAADVPIIIAPNIVEQAILAVAKLLDDDILDCVNVLGIEHSLNLQQYGKAQVGGRIDLIADVDSKIWIVDYKFLKPCHTVDAYDKLYMEYKDSVQLATYCHTWNRQALRLDRVAGAKILVLFKGQFTAPYVLTYPLKLLKSKKVLDRIYSNAQAKKANDTKNYLQCAKFGIKKNKLCPLFKQCSGAL